MENIIEKINLKLYKQRFIKLPFFEILIIFWKKCFKFKKTLINIIIYIAKTKNICIKKKRDLFMFS